MQVKETSTGYDFRQTFGSSTRVIRFNMTTEAPRILVFCESYTTLGVKQVPVSFFMSEINILLQRAKDMWQERETLKANPPSEFNT